MSAKWWIYLILGAALVAALGGSYVKGRSDGRALEISERATLEEVARVAREEASTAAAQAIASIKVNHTTIRGKVEREVIERPVYRDCVHPDSTFRMLNDALTNSIQPASDSSLPGPDATD